MPVNAVLIIGTGVHKIIGRSRHHRKFVTCLFIEMGVTNPSVHRAMADAEVDQLARILGADRNVPRALDHPRIDATVPA
jgi:hypothetical protein